MATLYTTALSANGHDTVLRVDLKNPQLDVPVVKVIVPRWYSFERWQAPLQCGADTQYAARWQHHLNKVARAYSLLTGRSMKVTQSLMEGD